MFSLNYDQTKAFQEDLFLRLCAWLLPHLRRHFEERLAGTDDATLAAMIERSVARARAMGASNSQTLCYYVQLCAVFGEAFPRQDWARAILADRSGTADDKIRRLAARGLTLLKEQEA